MIILKTIGALVALALLAIFAIVTHDRWSARRARRNYERLEFEQNEVAAHIIRDPAVMHRNAQKAIDRAEGGWS